METISNLRTHKCLREIMANVDPQWWAQLWWRPTNKTTHHTTERTFHNTALLGLIPELEYLNQDAMERKCKTALDYIRDDKYRVYPGENCAYRYGRSRALRKVYRTIATIPLFSAVGEVKVTYDDGDVKVSNVAPIIAFNIYKNTSEVVPGVVLPAGKFKELCDNAGIVNNRTQYMLHEGTFISHLTTSVHDSDEFIFDVGGIRDSAKTTAVNGYVPDWIAHRTMDWSRRFVTALNKQAVMDAVNKDVKKLSQERDDALTTIREICKSYV